MLNFATRAFKTLVHVLGSSCERVAMCTEEGENRDFGQNSSERFTKLSTHSPRSHLVALHPSQSPS